MTAHRALHDMLIADAVLVDPGPGKTVSPDRDRAVLQVDTAASETRVLGAPSRAGQELQIVLSSTSGDLTVTQSGSAAFNVSGNTTLTFDTAGDNATVVAIDIAGSLSWRIKSNDGAALS